MSEREQEGARILRMIGAYWRRDWSDFDGRTLRNQLEQVADYLEGGLPPDTDYLEDHDE